MTLKQKKKYLNTQKSEFQHVNNAGFVIHPGCFSVKRIERRRSELTL